MKSKIEKDLYFIFRDNKPMMALAWSEECSFGGYEGSSFGQGNILRNRGDAIVSPANSYGNMDGGIDRAYRNYFGLGVERIVKTAIRKRYGNPEMELGEAVLPVGEAVIVPTREDRIPFMVVAPTMKTPQDIRGTNNVYLAMRAVLEETLRFNHYQERDGRKVIQKVLCPGMGTGWGRMDPFESAEQMRKAFDDVSEELIANENDINYLLRR